jgi:hypothetical protein
MSMAVPERIGENRTLKQIAGGLEVWVLKSENHEMQIGSWWREGINEDGAKERAAHGRGPDSHRL